MNRPIMLSNTLIFHRRSQALTRLGYSSYDQYLRSALWNSIRCAVLAGGRRCSLCHSRLARQVHHQSYTIKVLAGRDASRLIPICRKCHERIELNPDGTKRCQSEVWRCCRLVLNRGW